MIGQAVSIHRTTIRIWKPSIQPSEIHMRQLLPQGTGACERQTPVATRRYNGLIRPKKNDLIFELAWEVEAADNTVKRFQGGNPWSMHVPVFVLALMPGTNVWQKQGR